MEIIVNLEENHFKDDKGNDTLYYRLVYNLDDDNYISLPIKKTEAMVIMLNEKNKD